MKLIFKSLIIVMSMLILSNSVFAFAPYLVLDADNNPQLPRKFRTTPPHSKLHIMGSAQFSEENLNFLIANHLKPTVIFDLRQESHGFLNGSAISWYGKHNWQNIKKNEFQIQAIENKLLTLLKNQNTEIVYRTKPNKDPMEIHPYSVINEQQLAQKYNIDYVRIPVADHRRPSDLQVDFFVNKIKQIPLGDRMYFHCRGGKGRTTSFMAMVDMMYNAKNASFQEIIQRQLDLGGQDLMKKNKSKKLDQYATQRLQFLKSFYLYSQQNTDNFTTGWSEWSANHS